ncbi:hypothetical protein B0T10DRAFT_461566 [Thelonectria olida]|uniref:Uncharacterized protein n=1 Tax=Thelonectria olida TaxID=1576542 RepID=A0A9P9ANN1_9HYPO|nr:hypothetical protein B0T10DRAFT_461566 [Thelonectria olida]
MTKYAPSLSQTGSGNKMKDALRKIQLKLDEGDINKFRGEIMGYSASLEIILHATTVLVAPVLDDEWILIIVYRQMMKCNQTNMQNRVSLMETRMLTSIKEQAVNIQTLVRQLAHQTSLGLKTIISMGKDFNSASRRIATIGCAVYRELRGCVSSWGVWRGQLAKNASPSKTRLDGVFRSIYIPLGPGISLSASSENSSRAEAESVVLRNVDTLSRIARATTS